MLWKNNRPAICRGHSVFEVTAQQLGLEYWEREPLKLDGAFYRRSAQVDYDLPFPMDVVFEHENFDANFRHEIRKLMSIRCPLKVGVTYTWDNLGPLHCEHQKRRQAILQDICAEYARIASVVAEDPRTEYAFLVGSEESEREFTWYAALFLADTGPHSQFVRV